MPLSSVRTSATNVQRSQNFLLERINALSDAAGVEVLSIFPNDLRNIRSDIRLDESEWEDGEIREGLPAFVEKFNIAEDVFKSLKEENVGERPILELFRTHRFLKKKFGRASWRLKASGFNSEDIADACIRNGIPKIIQAGKSERKLKNGEVVSMVKASPERLGFEIVPYYAFAFANVSLDEVRVRREDGREFTLREINSMIGWISDDGEWFLPNSLGVSACLLCKSEDGPVFVWQDRNNSATLTQRKWLVSAASWAVNRDVLTKMLENGHSGSLQAGISAELSEELGIDQTFQRPVNLQWIQNTIKERVRTSVESVSTSSSSRLSFLSGSEFLFSQMEENLRSEIGMVDAVQIAPVALVFEESRKNPEILFLAITNQDFDRVTQRYEKAEDRWETKRLVWMDEKTVNAEIRKIRKGEPSGIDRHFLMGYLSYALLFSGAYLES